MINSEFVFYFRSIDIHLYLCEKIIPIEWLLGKNAFIMIQNKWLPG